jgi:hypothetical protein
MGNARSCPQEWQRGQSQPWPGPKRRRKQTC